jgi:GNAT superfamily N-acetyltransferase
MSSGIVISIRKATKSDAGVAWEIRNAAINNQCKGYYPEEDLKSWTRRELPDNFVDMVADYFYMAVLNGRVVGTGMIDLDSGKLDALFVHPNHMGIGVGRRILLHLEQLAIAAGLTQLKLNSTLNACSYYQAYGFEGNKVSKYRSPRGVSLDCIPMKKSIGNDA